MSLKNSSPLYILISSVWVNVNMVGSVSDSIVNVVQNPAMLCCKFKDMHMEFVEYNMMSMCNIHEICLMNCLMTISNEPCN